MLNCYKEHLTSFLNFIFLSFPHYFTHSQKAEIFLRFIEILPPF